ncbi:hypothetical protein WJX79_002301 [Trebouxia sp. C0005]
MDQTDTEVEAIQHSDASWLFARAKSESQATTPTMLSGGRSIGSQKENLPPETRTPTPFKLQSSTPISGSVQSVQVQNTARRRAAAEWIEELTGIALPTSSDHAFRGALRDGILLCKVLNILRPGIIPQVQEEHELDPTSGQPTDTGNAQKFIDAVQRLQLPSASQFALKDLQSTGWEDRERITECLLTLKRYYEAEQKSGVAVSPFTPFQSPTKLARDSHLGPQADMSRFSPLQLGSSFTSKHAATPDFDLVTQQYMSGGSNSLKQVASKGTAGVTRLMQQCTAMLRDRMWSDGGNKLSPARGALPYTDNPMDAMGPVLESVLGSLTQEYEKRLLAKDHDLKCSQAQLEHIRHELAEAKRIQAEGSNLLPAPEAHEGMSADERAELEAMHAHERQLTDELDRLDAELAETKQRAEAAEAEKQTIYDEFQSLQAQVDDLQDMAGKYADTVEENRKLYNEVQDLKGNIRVFCRIRPPGTTGDQNPSCLDTGVDGEVAIQKPGTTNRKQYKYDKVFGPESNQEQVYEDTKALIRSVLDGYNVCIFAYGQTGSGKTHTMAGTNIEQYEGRGINYRALDDLFALNKKREAECEYQIQVQLLEIYNEQLRDLLDNSRSHARLDIRNTERSGLNVPDAIQVKVACTQDVLNVMEIGQRNRSVAETKMNERSSRSHSVLTIIVDGLNNVTGIRTHGCLHLIDLAGSERVGKSEATGDRLEEAKHINKSLSALGDVMSALANKQSHIPFRNSKLTQLLQDSLCGQAKAMMFVHIAPECSSYGESISTLGFGSRVSEITLGQAKKNSESAQIFEAKDQVVRFQREAEAARRDAAAFAEDKQRMEQEMAYMRLELEAARRAGSSPSRSVASSLAESDSIPAFNPVSGGTMPPSGAHKRPSMSLLNLNRAKGLTDSRAASPASASKVPSRAASPALSPAGDLLLRRSSSGTPRASLATPKSEPSKGLLRRSDSGGLRGSSGRPLTARPGTSPSGASTPRDSPTTSRPSTAQDHSNASGRGTTGRQPRQRTTLSRSSSASGALPAPGPRASLSSRVPGMPPAAYLFPLQEGSLRMSLASPYSLDGGICSLRATSRYADVLGVRNFPHVD